MKYQNIAEKKPEKYTLVDNPRINYNKLSVCWYRCALPAIQDESKTSHN